MSKFILSKEAHNDLKDIGQYTLKIWGKEQRDKYLRELDRQFQSLAQNPGKGQSRSNVRENYRSFRQNRHVIYYQEEKSQIRVVRILHINMDVTKHL